VFSSRALLEAAILFWLIVGLGNVVEGSLSPVELKQILSGVVIILGPIVFITLAYLLFPSFVRKIIKEA